MSEIIKGFKGYNKDLKCRDYQYEVGKEYEEQTAEACRTGFHFCENPLDIFNYYPPSDSRFTEVEGSGVISKENSDSKVACSKIKIGAEITLGSIIKGGVKFIFDKVTWSGEKSSSGYCSGASSSGNCSGASSSGNCSGASSSGYKSGASSSGDYSGASSSGNCSGATAVGDQSSASTVKGGVATAIGKDCKVKGKIGAWLVLVEGAYDEEGVFYIKNLKSKVVDGKTIKEDTFYSLVDNKIVPVK